MAVLAAAVRELAALAARLLHQDRAMLVALGRLQAEQTSQPLVAAVALPQRVRQHPTALVETAAMEQPTL